jgi:hypothetical protein
MTVVESLKKRASFLVIGGVSFAMALGVTRYGAGDPLFQPQSDLGILLGLALVMLYLVHNDTREDSGSDHASKTGLN